MTTEIYTNKDWSRDGSLRLTKGQNVSDEVVEQLAVDVPPMIHPHRNDGGLFQCGEPYRTAEDGRFLYRTFRYNGGGVWQYVGECFAGSQTTDERGDQ